MDSPPQSSTPFIPPAPHPHHKLAVVFFWSTFVSAAVMGLYLLGLYGYINLGNGSGPELYMTVSNLPASQLYEVNVHGSSLKPVVAPGEPAGDYVIDQFKDATTTYYLIASASGLTSNIFKSVGGAPITQISNSNTFKYDLSYDPTTGYFAYLSGIIKNQADMVTMAEKSQFNAVVASTYGTKTITSERVITADASAVQIVPSAFMLVVEKVNGLYAYSLLGNINRQIYTSKTSVPFALSANGTLALYNATTHAINLYRLGGGFNSLSYVGSEKAALVPTAVGVEGGQYILAQGHATASTYASELLVAGVDTPLIIANPDPTTPSEVPQKLLYE